MKAPALAFASLATAVAALSYSSTAHAIGPVDIEIAARGGYATNPGSGANPYGFGIGGRAGVSIIGIYAGVSGMYYFGSTQQASVGGVPVSSSPTTAMEGFEAGYTFKLSILKIRPQVGVGNATFGGSGSVDVNGSSTSLSGSSSNLYVEPGALVMVMLGSTFFVGADVNALILPSVADGTGTTTTYTSLSFHAQLGVQF
jgi:hypothetical protein